MGSKGELEARMGSDRITVYDFITRKWEEIMIKDAVLDESIASGHGGGDAGIIQAFCQLLAGNYKGKSVANITTSIENHLATFAAEESRLKDKVIFMDEYRDKIYQEIQEHST